MPSASRAAKNIPLDALLAAYANAGTFAGAARLLGVVPSGVSTRIRNAGVKSPEDAASALAAHGGQADPCRTPDEIREARRVAYARKSQSINTTGIVRMRPKASGPYGILLIGDWHLDDDGTDLDLIYEHVELVQNTPGLFAGHVGDYTNNWVGRLQALYAAQTTTGDEAWRLFEDVVSICLGKWLFWVQGNHDCWSGAGHILSYLARTNSIAAPRHGARFELADSTGRRFRLNCRHDFKGNSQFNPLHGLHKAVQSGQRDDLLVAGHRHISATAALSMQDTMGPHFARLVRLGSYKTHDDFAQAKGFIDGPGLPAMLALVNPGAKTSAGYVTIYEDLEQGVDILNYWRRKK